MPLTQNPYTYVENQPVNRIDPAGTTSKDSFRGVGYGGGGGGGGGWGDFDYYPTGTGSFEGVKIPFFWKWGGKIIDLFGKMNPEFNKIPAVKWFKRINKTIKTINDIADVYQFSQERNLDASQGRYGTSEVESQRSASGVTMLYALDTFGCIKVYTP